MLRIASSLLLCLLVLGTGCKSKNSEAVNTAVVSESDAGSTRAEHEASLRRTVEKHVEIVARTSGSGKDEILHRKPYWYREYVQYPDSASTIAVNLIETESLTRPYQAEVEISKVRFATRLHRERKAATADDNFLRATGTETQSYELRNSHWIRTGSMFVADSTEENIAGTWTPVNEQATIAVQAEESDGFLSKTWSFFKRR